MHSPYEWQLGLRYTRAGRAGESNGFISFISAISVVGIALGVAALIIILSVMNGFQKEVRDRMLSVLPHLEISAKDGSALEDWRRTAADARAVEPRIVGSAPFISVQALVTAGDVQRGAAVRGIDPAEEAAVTPLGGPSGSTALSRLSPGAWGLVLGGELARQLSVLPGDKLTVVAPGGQVTPAGLVPRLKQFTLVGVVDSGNFELDSSLALVHLDDAARLFRTGGATGVQLKLDDQLAARAVGQVLQDRLTGDLTVSDWTRVNRNWYDAVQVEKRLMAIILTLIVAVAAFNLVSSLVMTVTDKRADIAILRTLGATPGSVMAIFVVQGALAGLAGTLGGLVLGLSVALNIDTVVPAVERALGVAFLPDSIYVISRMPSQVLASDIVPIAVFSLLLAFAATLYPSWRASRVNPAEALRDE